MQHYVYDALNVQTFGCFFPRFLQQVDILVLFILSNNFLTILRQNFLTPQEVGDWFGCERKKNGNSLLVFGLVVKKKKRNLFLSFLADSVFLKGKKNLVAFVF